LILIFSFSLAGLTTGCFQSYAERSASDAGSDPGAGADAAPDVPAEVLPDTPDDVPDDAPLEVPDVVVRCLYEPAGERFVGVPGHGTSAPRLFPAGSDVGVVMFHSGGEMWEHSYVGMTTVAADLSSNTPALRIGEESHGWGEVAPAGDTFGLCWHADPAYASSTYFRRHALDGTLVTTWSPFDPDGEACLGLLHGDGRFAVAWRHWNHDVEPATLASRVGVLDDAGNLVVAPVDLSVGEYPGRTPHFSWDGSQFLVTLADEGGIGVWRLSTSGVLSVGATVRAPGALHAELSWGGDRAAVVWLAGGDDREHRGLHLQVLDVAFAPLGDEFVVEPDGAGAAQPELVRVPDGWLLLWHRGFYPDEQVAMLLHLDPLGRPLEPRRLLHLGVNSGYGGPVGLERHGDVFVALSRYPEGSGLEQVHLQRWDCVTGELDVCAPQDAWLPLRCDDGLSLGWAWDGSACVELVGCSDDCVGADCGRLAHTQWDCLSDRQYCP
jgi:hypothetical protein